MVDNEKKKRTPNLRFEGFADDWMHRLLKSEATFSKGKGYRKKDLVPEGYPIMLYGKMYTNYQEFINDVDTFVADDTKSIKSTGNEVVVPSSGESSDDIVRASSIRKEGIILGGDLNIIHPSKNINSDFLALSISHGDSKKELRSKAQGTSITHLYNSDIEKIKIYYPHVSEQTEIVKVIRLVKNIITLEQEKLQEYKNLKTFLLRKMFPHKDEVIPELRFNNFNKNWKLIRLEDIGSISTGNTPKTSNTEYYDDVGVPWVTPTDIIDMKVEETGKKLSDSGRDVARVVPKDSILITSIASIGKNALTTEQTAFNQQINALNPYPDNDSYFLYTQSYFWSEYMKRIASTGTMQIVNKTEFSRLLTVIPIYEEQHKIGVIFKKINKIINYQGIKIDSYISVKNMLLNNLFI